MRTITHNLRRFRPNFITKRPAGFTLVELLVVIVIIGILMALCIPTMLGVFRSTRTPRISNEIGELKIAIEEFKNRYNTYPADFSNQQVVNQVIKKAFPQILPPSTSGMPSAAREVWPVGLDPAEALVFWLGGFSDDARHPFTGPGGPLRYLVDPTNADRKCSNGVFCFDLDRLTIYGEDLANGNIDDPNGVQWSNDESGLHAAGLLENDPYPVYLPVGLKQPYVLFDSRTYIHRPVNGPVQPPPVYPPPAYSVTTTIRGVCRPYRSNTPRRVDAVDPVPFEWVNPDTFQIISAGLDSNYGADNIFKQYPGGNNYNDGDETNITDFSQGNTLRDQIP